MSLPTTVITYRPPPETFLPPTSGAGGGGGETGGGGGGTLPLPPTENPEIYYLRGDEEWAPVLYQHIIGIPIHFAPSSHAPTHAPDGTDPITNLVPPVLNDPGQVLLSTGGWGFLDYSALTGTPPPGGAPGPHGHTHVTTDLVDLATIGHPGLFPKLPIGGSSAYYLGSDLSWYPIPAGSGLPDPPGDPTLVLLGTGTYGQLAYSSLSGIPPVPSLPPHHASTHQLSGSDPLPLDTLAAPTDTTYLNTSTLVHGLCPKLSNVVTTYLNGTGKWTTPPSATTLAPGYVNPLSGNVGDYVGGDNACHAVPTTATGLLPAGAVIDYAGPVAPVGWLLCDGTSYPQATYPALYAALGGASSPWGVSGANFNVPDLRGRTSIGAGQGTYTGASLRTLGGTGGEELHVLLSTELVSHTHGVAHTHTMGSHTHTLGSHVHNLTNHQHTMGNHTHTYDHYHNVGWDHCHFEPAVNHLHGLNNHVHGAGYNPAVTTAAAGPNVYASNGLTTQNTGGPNVGTTEACDRTITYNSYYASQTNGGWGNSNTNWASQQGYGTSAGPSTNTSDGMTQAWNTGGPSTNTSDGPSTNTTDGASIANTAATGGGGGFNVMQPYAIVNKIIKT